MRSSFHLKKLAQLGMFIVSLFCFQSALFAQTPSSYPYFNRIHLASDSTHPSFYHFYAGGTKLSADTILILGQQFLFGNEQIYQRTFEFIDANSGEQWA
jgi:hypothetical protein